MAKQLIDLYRDWFQNPQWWFSATADDDKFITATYCHLLSSEFDIFSPPHEKIALVIAYDQIARHVFRSDQSAVQSYLDKALAVSTHLINYNCVHNQIAPKEWCFVLLPLRHSNISSNIFTAITFIWNILLNTSIKEDEVTLCKRFLKAAYQRAPIDQSDFIEVHFSNASSMEHPGCNPLYKNVIAHIVLDGQIDWTFHSQITSTFQSFLKQYPRDTYIISLSGGVDSMLCLYLFSRYQSVFGYDLIAVHINYRNKPTNTIEEQFLKDWCSFLKIKLIIRRINEIRRDPCMHHEMRELYETYTRNVRYGTYKAAAVSHAKPSVVLGHNKDDCFENILTNITNVRKYENLMGMEIITCTNDIEFVRPLLTATKEEIRLFAKVTGIPHFHDSTPSWSQRGKIRDTVRPCLNKWDDRCIPAFFNLSKVVADAYNILDTIATNMLAKSRDSIILLSVDDLLINDHVWRTFIKGVTCINISQASLSNILQRFTKIKKEYYGLDATYATRIEINKNLFVHVQKIEEPKIKITFVKRS